METFGGVSKRADNSLHITGGVEGGYLDVFAFFGGLCCTLFEITVRKLSLFLSTALLSYLA